jgi:hypothetical protein
MHFLQVMSDTIQALTVTVLSEETKWLGHTRRRARRNRRRSARRMGKHP